MLYFDTSFVVPLVLSESTSALIQRFFARLKLPDLAISHWTRVEFSSVLARRVRMGHLTPKAALRADVQFEAIVNESFVVLPVNTLDFDLAREYLMRHRTTLRANDALHLAIASNQQASAIFTLDRRLIRAGRTLQLPARQGIRLSS